MVGARHAAVVGQPDDLDVVDLHEDGNTVDRRGRRYHPALIFAAHDLPVLVPANVRQRDTAVPPALTGRSALRVDARPEYPGDGGAYRMHVEPVVPGGGCRISGRGTASGGHGGCQGQNGDDPHAHPWPHRAVPGTVPGPDAAIPARRAQTSATVRCSRT